MVERDKLADKSELLNKTTMRKGYLLDPFSVLNECQKVYIRSLIDFGDFISDFYTNCKYLIYAKTKDPFKDIEVDENLFYAIDSSNYCGKRCCKSDTTPFSLILKQYKHPKYLDEFDVNNFAVFGKGCSCITLGCEIELSGNYRSSKGSCFGKIIKPYSCCDPVFLVKNPQGKIRYRISTECCQYGLDCPNCCSNFTSITFNIFDDNKKVLDKDGNKKDSSSVGKIIKKSKKLSTINSKDDNINIEFPKDAEPDMKLTLIGIALLIDYYHF